MLTKEECKKALLSVINPDNLDEFLDGKETLEQLINDHFANPSLKLEALKKDMWVWDVVTSKYRKIKEIRDRKIFFDTQKLGVNYKDDRFYRYEVKSDE